MPSCSLAKMSYSNCIICHDDIKECREAKVVHCRNHEVHVECLLAWHDVRKSSEDQKRICFLCQSSIEENEYLKVVKYAELEATEFLEDIRDGREDHVTKRIKGGRVIPAEMYCEAVCLAIALESVNIAKMLRDDMEVHVSDEEDFARLIIRVSRLMSPFGLSWMANDLKTSLDASLVTGTLNLPMLEFLRSAEAFQPLFEIYCVYFPEWSFELQLEATVTLFKAAMARKFIMRSFIGKEKTCCQILKFVWLFHPNLQCNVLKTMAPSALPYVVSDIETLEMTHLPYCISFCRQCYRSHMWDAVMTIIKNNDLEFLALFMQSPRFDTDHDVSYDGLANCILSTKRPAECKEIVEKYHIFSLPERWEQIYGRLQKKMEKRQMKKSRPSFWSRILNRSGILQ